MVEFLIASMQGLCIVGLLSGAYLCIAYGPETEAAPAPSERFDPGTGHNWSVYTPAVQHGRR